MVEVLFLSLTEDHNVIQVHHYELVNGHKMSSINLMKVVGAFVNPKGMTSHSKRPSALKEIFHTLEGLIGTW